MDKRENRQKMLQKSQNGGWNDRIGDINMGGRGCRKIHLLPPFLRRINMLLIIAAFQNIKGVPAYWIVARRYGIL